MNRRPFLPLAVAALLASTGAFAADDAASIAKERAAAEARYSAREKECRSRFVVTSCVDDAKQERRRTLDALRVRQRALDDAQRRERADKRRAELADKASEDERRNAERAAQAAKRASEPAKSGQPFETPSASKSNAKPKPAAGRGFEKNAPTGSADRAEAESRKREAYEKRQRDAVEHREKSVDRSLRRMAQKSPASPLPSPASAPSAPR